MNPLLVQLLFSLLVIVLTIGMMVFMYLYMRGKIAQERNQKVQRKEVGSKEEALTQQAKLPG